MDDLNWMVFSGTNGIHKQKAKAKFKFSGCFQDIWLEWPTKISLFDDDTLLTIENLLKTMERVKSHLKDFGKVTSLQIIWHKLEMLIFNYNKEEK